MSVKREAGPFRCIVAMGDSISMGASATRPELAWVSRLGRLLAEFQDEPPRIVNVGLSGNLISPCSRAYNHPDSGKPSALERYRRHVHLGRLGAGQRARDEVAPGMRARLFFRERAGGNLTGLLKLNSNTVRERHKMRLKIKAASSEGRASAMILTGAPIVTLGFISVSSPHFYGDVIQEPMVKIGLVVIGVWLLIGNLVMRRMIDMRI